MVGQQRAKYQRVGNGGFDNRGFGKQKVRQWRVYSFVLQNSEHCKN
jgi:hypothetical protein